MNTNTVYLIDDDKLNLEQLISRRNLFFACGFEIAGTETDPYKALDAIRTIRPDAVFSDLKMPGMSGIELWDTLREDERPPVFVIISAYNEIESVRRVFKTNGFDYLVKPVSNAELTDLLVGVGKRIHKQPPVLDEETESDELNGILAFMNEYPAMDHSLEVTAERCKLSPRTVSRLFTKYLNTTFIAYLTHVRMKKAEELLLTTDMRLKQISAGCGYPDPYYFTRIFKREHGGLSPTEYREEKRGRF